MLFLELKKVYWGYPFFRPEEIEGDSFTVTVDCADHGRVGNELCNRFPDVHLNIDHHVSNNNYARTNLVLSNAAATGEILAKFFFRFSTSD